MAKSNVNIANQALDILGHESITSLDEGTETADAVDNLFETVRDTVMVNHPWNCLLARTSLAQNATAPTFGYDYAYTLPSNCLRVVYCDCVEDGYTWKVEGRNLVTNADTPLYILYIKQDTDVNNWSIYLYDLVVLKLAAKLALALTEDGAKAKALEELYQIKEREARFLDAAEGSPKVIDTDTFIQNRRGVYNPLAVY